MALKNGQHIQRFHFFFFIFSFFEKCFDINIPNIWIFTNFSLLFSWEEILNKILLSNCIHGHRKSSFYFLKLSGEEKSKYMVNFDHVEFNDSFKVTECQENLIRCALHHVPYIVLLNVLPTAGRYTPKGDGDP